MTQTLIAADSRQKCTALYDRDPVTGSCLPVRGRMGAQTAHASLGFGSPGAVQELEELCFLKPLISGVLL